MGSISIFSQARQDERATKFTPFAGGRVASCRLLGHRGELIIEHNGREYRLRITRNGKLILTA